MDIEEKKAFRQAVYDVVRTVPRGRVTTYGAIAKAIGYPLHSRMVGRMMAECESFETGLPAHRVVNSSGCLSGKRAFGIVDEMQQLLASEGVVVENDKIKQWKKVFWNPLEEIMLSE